MADYERLLIPFGKFAPDEPYLADSPNLAWMENLLYHDGAVTLFNDPATSVATLGTLTPSAGISWSDESGANRCAIGFVEGHLYAADVNFATINDRCKLGHYTAGAHWDFVKYGPQVIATNGADPVQLFNFTAPSADLITSTTKPKGKYLATCRGHVILLDITAPVVNPREFRWSALNDSADWEPGSDRSGFGELPADAGIITGGQGFEDFFLIFTTTSVYRASYIGGADVWSLQQIGGFFDGLPSGFAETIIAVERNAYYFGRTGPKVVMNGERVQDLGVGTYRRHLLNFGIAEETALAGPIDTTIPFGQRVCGCFDGFRQIIYWGWGTDFERLGVGITALCMYAYSLNDDALSLLFPDESQGLIGAGPFATYGAFMPRPGGVSMQGSGFYPGFGLMWVKQESGLAAVRTTNVGTWLNAKVVTKSRRPSHAKTHIHAIRPLWRLYAGNGETDTPNLVFWISAPTSGLGIDTSLASPDERGFYYFANPISAAEIQVHVEIKELGGMNAKQIRDFVGVELLVKSEVAVLGGYP